MRTDTPISLGARISPPLPPQGAAPSATESPQRQPPLPAPARWGICCPDLTAVSSGVKAAHRPESLEVAF